MKRFFFSGSALFSVSQGFSSISNLLIGIGLSRNMSATQFGSVALVLTFIYFAVSLQRSSIGDSSLIFSPTHPGISRAAVNVTLLTAVSVFAIMTVAHCIFSSLYPTYLPLLGGVLVAQDGLRYGLVAIKKRMALFVGDILWVANSGLVLVLVGSGGLDLRQAIEIWLTIACGICVFLWLQFKAAGPSGTSVAEFVRITSRVSGWSALQFVLGNGSIQAALTLFALAVGANNFAGFRATQMVLSPLIVGTLALASPLLSFIVSRRETGWSKAQAYVSSAILGVGVGALGAVAAWQGRWLIELIPGAQYVGFRDLLIPGAVALVFVAANVPIASSLLSMMKGRSFFMASVGATVPTSALIVWAAVVGGLRSAAWAMAFQYAVITVSCAVALGLAGKRTNARRSLIQTASTTKAL
ncbi:hypothetical protein [Pseudarthrobacter sp. NPDC080039]|uniref:hypothetical protein n=1 Tax=unclassified Pseudarthrobacter TaxID=2647000 RepID=UPI00344BB711